MISTEYAKFYCGYKNIDNLPCYYISFNRVLPFSVSAFIIQECIMQRVGTFPALILTGKLTDAGGILLLVSFSASLEDTCVTIQFLVEL